MVRRTGCCSGLGVAVSGPASLVGVIYRLVGMCCGARRIMSFLLGKETYRIMCCLYVNMRSYKGKYSQGAGDLGMKLFVLAYCITLSTLAIQPDDGLYEGRNM